MSSIFSPAFVFTTLGTELHSRMFYEPTPLPFDLRYT